MVKSVSLRKKEAAGVSPYKDVDFICVLLLQLQRGKISAAWYGAGAPKVDEDKAFEDPDEKGRMLYPWTLSMTPSAKAPKLVKDGRVKAFSLIVHGGYQEPWFQEDTAAKPLLKT
jgi:hypothetical protein